MVRIFNIDDNPNIVISDEKSNFKVLEHKIDYSSKNLNEAMKNFYFTNTNIFKKQLLISLENDSVCINPGNMLFMAGDIKVKTNVRGIGDLIGKAISSSVVGEAFIKPRYFGTGEIMLEYTYEHIILEELNSEKGVIISDGVFLACSGGVQMKAVPVSSITSATLGLEGVFHLLVKGHGVLSFLSPVPKEHITIVQLINDTLKVNGNYALAWSEGLSFTVENVSPDIFGTAISKEGFVNVYKGTGAVWISSVLPQNISLKNIK